MRQKARFGSALKGIRDRPVASGSIVSVSDYGFDAYAVADLGPTGESHPLEIARDLIESGKPRSALEVLAQHHKRLADDPEYLMLCGRAWYDADEAGRAQHAWLGAARVAPADPRPLRMLGELLMERGEPLRAQRVFDKADRLSNAEAVDETALEDLDGAATDDLIAFAEREAQTRYAAVGSRQLLLVLGMALGVAFVMSGIARLVSVPEEAAVARSPRATRTGEASRHKSAAVLGSTEQHGPTESEALPLLAPVVAPEFSTAGTEAAAVDDVASLPAPTVTVPKVPDVPVGAPRPTEGREEPADRSAGPVAAESPRQQMPRPARKRRRPVGDGTRPPTGPELDAELQSLADAAEATARGDALTAIGETVSASMLYRRALDLDPDYAPALVGMGRGLLRAEKYSDAMRNATRALQLARGVDTRPGLEAEALYQIGRVHHERGEEDAARRLLRQSTSLSGAPAAAWFYLGESLSQDNSPAARNAYEQYLRRRPRGHLSDRARRAIQ